MKIIIPMENKSSMSKYFILSALKRKDMHGYELIMELERIMGKKPSASQIYPVLKKMKSSGYVIVETRMSGRKKIKSYKITGSGRLLFAGLNKRFDALVEATLRNKIKVCVHCGCEMVRGAVQKKVGGRNMYFCCEMCAKSYKHK